VITDAGPAFEMKLSQRLCQSNVGWCAIGVTSPFVNGDLCRKRAPFKSFNASTICFRASGGSKSIFGKPSIGRAQNLKWRTRPS
jgi:hypothetical protein